MLITKSQGVACRRAAERLDGADVSDFYLTQPCAYALLEIGAFDSVPMLQFVSGCTFKQDPNVVIMALLWCAEIAGSE